jgi:hypothetical protein
MAEIIEHQKSEETYDDPDHPIPALNAIDINTVKKSGGSDLHIIIASPLQADEYSLTRLLDKIEGYLGHIQSDDYKKESGSPTPENTRIIVNIHPESDENVFELLERSKPWALENNAALEIEILEDKDNN